jgi:hypothetical protein
MKDLEMNETIEKENVLSDEETITTLEDEIVPPKKKRVLTEKQKEATKLNLQKGRDILREKRLK